MTDLNRKDAETPRQDLDLISEKSIFNVPVLKDGLKRMVNNF